MAEISLNRCWVHNPIKSKVLKVDSELTTATVLLILLLAALLVSVPAHAVVGPGPVEM